MAWYSNPNFWNGVLNFGSAALDYKGGKEMSEKAGQARPNTPQEDYFFGKQKESLDGGNPYRNYLTGYATEFLKNANSAAPSYQPQFRSNYMRGQAPPGQAPGVSFGQGSVMGRLNDDILKKLLSGGGGQPQQPGQQPLPGGGGATEPGGVTPGRRPAPPSYADPRSVLGPPEIPTGQNPQYGGGMSQESIDRVKYIADLIGENAAELLGGSLGGWIYDRTLGRWLAPNELPPVSQPFPDTPLQPGVRG